MTYYAMNGLGATPTTLGQDIVAKATQEVDAYVLPIGHVPMEYSTDSDIESQGMDQRVWNMPLKPTLGGLKKLWDSGKGLVDEEKLAQFATGSVDVGLTVLQTAAAATLGPIGAGMQAIFGLPQTQVLARDSVRLVTWMSDLSAAIQRSEKSGDVAAAACYSYVLALTMRSVKRLMGGSLLPEAQAKIAAQDRQSLIDAKVAQATGQAKGLQLVGISLKQQQELAAAKAAAAKAAADAAAQAEAAVAKAMSAADAKTKNLLADAQQRLRAAQQAAQSDVQAAKDKGSQTTLLVAAGVGVVAVLAAVFYMKKKG
jgi:hypothetical protein